MKTPILALLLLACASYALASKSGTNALVIDAYDGDTITVDADTMTTTTGESHALRLVRMG